MTKVLSALAIVMSLSILAITCPRPADAGEIYAAFAVVPGQGATFHGYGRGETARKARRAALAVCGRRRCKVVQKYRQGQCAHVVLGTFQVFWNETGYTKARGREILAHCNKFDKACRVVVAECL